MIVSASLSVLLAVAVVVLVRRGAVRVGSALVCALAGFEIASTSIAPSVTGVITSVAGWVGSLHL